VRYCAQPCGKGKVFKRTLEGEVRTEREAQESVARLLLVDTDTGEVRMEPV